MPIRFKQRGYIKTDTARDRLVGLGLIGDAEPTTADVTPPSSGGLASAFGKSVELIKELGGKVAGGIREVGADVSRFQRGAEPKSLLGRSIKTVGKTFGEGVEAIEAEELGEQPKAETIYQTGGITIKGVADIFGDAFMSTLKTLAPDELQEQARGAIEAVVNTEGGQKVVEGLQKAQDNMEFLEKNDPEAYRNFKATFGILEGAVEAVGLGTGKRIAKGITEGVEGGIKEGVSKIQSIGIKPSEFKIPEKVKEIGKGIKQRIETGSQELKGVVGKEPIITKVKGSIEPVIDKEVVKQVSQLNKAFTPLQKVRDGRVIRPQEVIDSQWGKILSDFEKKGIKPKNMKEFRDNMIKGQKDIYNVINPALKKSDVKIDLIDAVQKSRSKIPADANVFAKADLKKIDDIIDGISEMPTKSMEGLEKTKQFVNSITDFNAQGTDKVFNNFLRDLTHNIGDLQDDILGKIEGQSTIKDLKKVYGAYSDMLGDVNKSIIKYERKAPIGLFSGLGRIAGLGNIIEGAIKGDVAALGKGLVQVGTGEAVKNINDANNIIKRAFKGKAKVFTGTPKPLKKKQLALPSGKVVTPQTKERGVIIEEKKVIIESKKGLEKTKVGTTKLVEKKSKKEVKKIIPLKKKIPKELEGLSKEVKKYKNTDEFIKGLEDKGDIVYHGTNAKFDEFDISKIGSQTDEGLWGRGFYFATDKNTAKSAPGMKGMEKGAKYVKEVYVDKNNLFDIAKYDDIQKVADALDMSELNFTMGTNGIIRPHYSQVRQFTAHIEELGFDGVYVNRGGKGDELVIFNTKNIKTESQLKDFYNKNKKGLKKKKKTN